MEVLLVAIHHTVLSNCLIMHISVNLMHGIYYDDIRSSKINY